jgi:hypothetical protein
MAWSAPRTWVSGELVTAALMNQEVKSNLEAIDGGRLAITSQAAGDVVYASSSTALARLAKSEGLFLKSGTSAVSWSPVTTVLAKTSDYTCTTSDCGDSAMILTTSSSGDVTITLYAASGNSGRVLHVKKLVAANSVILDGNSSETIDGATTATIDAQYTSLSLVCDGSNWHIF